MYFAIFFIRCHKQGRTVQSSYVTNASQDGFVPLEFTSAAFRLIDRFTCIMYNSTTSYDKVNDLRQEASVWRNSLKPINWPTLKALDGHEQTPDGVQSGQLYRLLL